jgi:hypothetical protein
MPSCFISLTGPQGVSVQIWAEMAAISAARCKLRNTERPRTYLMHQPDQDGLAMKHPPTTPTATPCSFVAQ